MKGLCSFKVGFYVVHSGVGFYLVLREEVVSRVLRFVRGTSSCQASDMGHDHVVSQWNGKKRKLHHVTVKSRNQLSLIFL